MRRTRMLLLGCGAAACAVLVIVSAVVGRGGGGGGGHISGHAGGGTMSGFHPGAIHSENRMMSRPSSHPGSWQTQQFRVQPQHRENFNQPRLSEGRDQRQLTEGPRERQPIENFNRFNAWGNRYGARWSSYNSWYHGNWYDHGHRWWNDGLAGWWWGDGAYDWGNGGYAAPWRWGYYPYDNPYCVLDSGTTVYDYSQPLILASPPADSAATELSDSEQDGMRRLDAAKDAFRQGDYDAALEQIDAAVKDAPEDRIMHEFRALALFALGRYQESAAAVYAVLSAGPGWDWTTLSGLYPSVDVYTQQLRKLETYATEHPHAGDALFLLGYQYLACGHEDAAATVFADAAKVNPKDSLSAQLAAVLKRGDKPATAATPAEPGPAAVAASLVGDWTAKRPDGRPIGLKLTDDNKFVWTVQDKDKPREFRGEYSLSDKVLILKQGDKAMMVGQVKSLPGGGFNFKVVGDNPSDPGLNFLK